MSTRIAYTAVVVHDGYAVGTVTENIPGYVIENPRRFETYKGAQEMAGALNLDKGLTPLEAWRVVASSIVSRGVRP